MTRPVGAIPTIEYVERLIRHSKDTGTIIPIYYVHDLEDKSFLTTYFITPETYIYYAKLSCGDTPFIKWSRLGYNNHFIFDIGFMANDYLETCLSPVLIL